MIWVIGGTSDAAHIVAKLKELNMEVLVSTTTSYGSNLAMKDEVTVIQRELALHDMREIITQYPIEAVIDASHPFAGLVSQNAIEACAKTNVRYLRFERLTASFPCAYYYSSYQQIVQTLVSSIGNILLTIGSKNLALFKTIGNERVIARVLPVQDSIVQCEKAGLQAHQIIATKGRVSQQTNKALMREYDIKHLVTKDSGEAGGLNEKIAAANELGITVHILERPAIQYPLAFCSYQDLIDDIIKENHSIYKHKQQ